MRYWVCTMLCLLCFCVTTSGQTYRETWDDFVLFVTSQQDSEDETLAAHLEELEYAHNHPLGINTATHQELEALPILSARQVLDLQQYIYRVGGIRTWHELIYVPTLDYDTRRWLPLFTTIDPMPVAQQARRDTVRTLRMDVQTAFDIPLYRRAGYDAANEDHRYQGSAFAHRFVARASIGRHYSVGLNIDKDAGEPIGRPFEMGYDHVGFYLTAKNLWNRCTIVAGDYRVGFGEGVLLNQFLFFGKETQRLNRANGIAAKTGTSETNYMRGVAATVALGSFSVTPFVSYTLLDATVQSATGLVTTLSTSSTHRNNNEIARRHVTAEAIYGTHAEWRTRRITLGATAFRSQYHLSFIRGDAAYREFYPEGDTFWGASINYGLSLVRFDFRGETATNGHGLATLNRFGWRFNSRWQAQMAVRYYDPRYHSFHSSALSEWGVQNEHGLYMLLRAHPWRPLNVSLSADLFHSPHARYQIDHPTDGQEFVVNATYDVNRRHALNLRATWRHKEQYNRMHVSQRYRLAWSAKTNTLSANTAAQLTHYSDAVGLRKVGYSLQETLRWQSRNDRMRLAMSAVWFDIDDYNSRLYITEPSLPSLLPYAMLYGEGVRLATTARVRLPWNFTATLRYAFVRYFDRDVIGNDLQQIKAPWQNDISLLVSWRM